MTLQLNAFTVQPHRRMMVGPSTVSKKDGSSLLTALLTRSVKQCKIVLIETYPVVSETPDRE
jgi:hypothetical protein